jgi:hypothetical protein
MRHLFLDALVEFCSVLDLCRQAGALPSSASCGYMFINEFLILLVNDAPLC